MEFKSESEIIGFLQCAGVSYSIAVLLNRLVKENNENALKMFKSLGSEECYHAVYRFYYNK